VSNAPYTTCCTDSSNDTQKQQMFLYFLLYHLQYIYNRQHVNEFELINHNLIFDLLKGIPPIHQQNYPELDEILATNADLNRVVRPHSHTPPPPFVHDNAQMHTSTNRAESIIDPLRNSNNSKNLNHPFNRRVAIPFNNQRGGSIRRNTRHAPKHSSKNTFARKPITSTKIFYPIKPKLSRLRYSKRPHVKHILRKKVKTQIQPNTKLNTYTNMQTNIKPNTRPQKNSLYSIYNKEYVISLLNQIPKIFIVSSETQITKEDLHKLTSEIINQYNFAMQENEFKEFILSEPHFEVSNNLIIQLKNMTPEFNAERTKATFNNANHPMNNANASHANHPMNNANHTNHANYSNHPMKNASHANANHANVNN
jgi:hypothetical protein